MKTIKSILWRKINKSTYETLTGVSKGQYHITLGTTEFGSFLEGLTKFDFNDKGGFKINIPLSEFIHSDPSKSVPAQSITLRFMGENSARKDWSFPSQRPDTAYPLWRPRRRLPSTLPTQSYIYIVRTTDDLFYARLVLDDEFPNLPTVIQNAFSEKEFGSIDLSAITISSEAKKIYDKLLKVHNILLYGPPGTGKTTLMDEVLTMFKNDGQRIDFNEASELNALSPKENKCCNSKTIWTTFHQSYSYEDFVIGLTTDNSGDKLLDISSKPGVLLELAEFARKRGNRSLLAIDELNRGNVSKIFGEFITLIEPDKRLDKNGQETSSTVKIRLPHIKFGEELKFTVEEGQLSFTNPFSMPYDVYTIASMNSVDRSVVPLDSALRRRFFRYDIMPDLNLLADKLKIDTKNISIIKTDDISTYCVADIKKVAWKLLDTLNKKITLFLGKDFTLGHSYVWRLTQKYETTEEALNELINSFNQQIYPQLEEIFKGRMLQLMYILKLSDEISNTKIFSVIEPSEEETELGATASIMFNYDNFSGITAVKWLATISEIKQILPSKDITKENAEEPEASDKNDEN